MARNTAATERAETLRRFDAAYLSAAGAQILAGVDEAGRGALAGPVVVGVVALDAEILFEGLDDSKRLSETRREELFPIICEKAHGVAIGWATAEEVDRLNVLAATLLAARRALDVLPVRPQLVLTDYLKIQGLEQPVEPLVKGDARSQAIAAASVVAKVTRDRWMRRYDAEYPEYGFAGHKGYGAQSHLDVLEREGSSTLHRHSFRGVDWFDREYRISRSFARLIETVPTDGMDETENRDRWLKMGYALPEYEERLFHQAVRHKKVRQDS
jgi:ribonuclease HII